MELIIAILFFSISGAICVQLFVKAHMLSENSVEMNNSVLWTQNISEVFCGMEGNLHSIADFYSDNSIVIVSYEDNPEVGTLVMFFDEDFELLNFLLKMVLLKMQSMSFYFTSHSFRLQRFMQIQQLIQAA